MKLYVASSWKNEYYDDVIKFLAKEHEVYDFKNPTDGMPFSWGEIDPEWEEWTTEEYLIGLQHPRALEQFARNEEAMEWADAGVLVLPCGEDANQEAGYLSGAGKPVFVLALDDVIRVGLMRLLHYRIHVSVEDLLEALRHTKARIQPTPKPKPYIVSLRNPNILRRRIN
jgi:hypothetical protein